MKNKTIVALATPHGIAGLSVIRFSGDEALNICSKVFFGKINIANAESHRIYYGKIIDNNELIDSVTLSYFKAPNSYTGEDIVEIGCHGGHVVYKRIINILLSHGAFAAEAGEFTKRAFINGKIDLTQAEAVADMIHSVSVAGVNVAARQLEGSFTNKIKIFRKMLLETAGLIELELDFAQEDIELIPRDKIIAKINETKEYCQKLASEYHASQILRNGYYIAIVGFPNSGKSSLFNLFLNQERAIVSEIAGTTRDYLKESIYINGYAINIFDTAGIRDTDDTIEMQGIKLVQSVMQQADLIILLNDANEGLNNSEKLQAELISKFPNTELFLVQNKTDLINQPIDSGYPISCKTGNGIEVLKQSITEIVSNTTSTLSEALINERHSALLQLAANSLDSAIDAINQDFDNEIIAIEIKSAVDKLGQITGENYSEEVINTVFSAFCIGK